MTSHWQPYREPLRITLLRTGTIALVVGAVLARSWGGLAFIVIELVVHLVLQLRGRPSFYNGRG